MSRADGVQVIDHRRVLRVHRRLLRRVANDALGGRQVAHADVRHVIVNRETCHGRFITHPGRAAVPA